MIAAAALTIPALSEMYPGWRMHNVACSGGCCDRCEALHISGTLQILLVRSTLEELAERLGEVTEDGARPAEYADVLIPDSATRLTALTGKHPEIELPRRFAGDPWTALVSGTGAHAISACSREALCDTLESALRLEAAAARAGTAPAAAGPGTATPLRGRRPVPPQSSCPDVMREGM